MKKTAGKHGRVLRDLLKRYGIKRGEAARLLGVDKRTMRRWLKGREEPPPHVLSRIRYVQAPVTRLGSHLRPCRAPRPSLPQEGPLAYERYLELLSAAAGARWSLDDEFEPYAWRYRYSRYRQPASMDHGPTRSRNRELLKEARRRFAADIEDFAITRLAARHELCDIETTVLARLATEDAGVFEGQGSVPGRALAAAAGGSKADLLKARAFLAPGGKLRRLNLIERATEGRRFFMEEESVTSVLSGCYRLTHTGRLEVLGPLLERSVLEEVEGFGTAIQPRFGLDAVVLGNIERDRIGQILAGLRHRNVLYEQWGFADRVHYGRGAILLFEGPPGTGKTMCAEGLARELGLRLLTASFPRIVSCWVGETEKNIAKLFRDAASAGALLFIDEADGLFSSRDIAVRSWEVRDVNVLLKEVEAFEGVCVLATNNAVILDGALESRLTLRLGFPMPDAAMREAIWKRCLPEKLPVEVGVDVARLARRYALSGRDIKQAALAAATAALRRAGPEGRITMADLEAAAEERCRHDGSRIGFGGA